MRMHGLGAVVALAAGLACTPAGPQVSTEIPNMSQRWEEALNAGDVDALAALYAEDARLMPPGAGLMTGREAARQMFGGMIAEGLGGDLETIEATAAGDVGYHVGSYSIRTSDGTVVDRGKFVEIWRRTPAGWQITNDIWNSDLGGSPGDAATIVITHEVKDPSRWLAAWLGEPSRQDMFKEHGVSAVRVFQSPDDAKRVALVAEVTDMPAFEAFISSPEAAAAKSEDGVDDSTIRVLAEAQ